MTQADPAVNFRTRFRLATDPAATAMVLGLPAGDSTEVGSQEPTGPGRQAEADPNVVLAQQVHRAAQQALEAIRDLNQLTADAPPLPAPMVLPVLTHLEDLGRRLHQGVQQLGVGLQRSLEEYELDEQTGAQPAVTADLAVFELLQALAAATEFARRIGRARVAVAGHRVRRRRT